jgi:hypothetical protein
MRRAKLIVFFAAVILLLGLTQCGKKQQNSIVGIWQMQSMVVNGTLLSGKSLGTWLWEFNGEGGYLTDVAGMREKGRYGIKDSILTLKILVPKDGPSQVYRIIKLDSAQMDLFSYDNRNKSTLHFIKRKVGEVEVDKD